ncbi:uncharacterized protein LOC126833296 [Adelges cooleyi]|uniref:uncharacterized protein LOC126833296 n=1 Tax=Adelges cooleyi TaxID=133065 RepID=UPI00217F6CA3|nr:uncharacterized protein LOC126833296 [Adelges cooleyi]
MELMDARTKMFYLIGIVYIIQLVDGDARTTRADINAVLGGSEDPNFWPSRGRRNNPVPNKFKQYWDRKFNIANIHGNLEKPLYVEEPMWVTMDRRADVDDDYFWVTRGRRASSWKHPTFVKFSSNTYRDEMESKVK